MNEIKQVIILAAGRSRRMESLCNNGPKCLLKYNDEIILCRLVRQIKENGIKKIIITAGYKSDLLKKLFLKDDNVIIVENKMYDEDVNIYSMKLALDKINGPVVVFEADTIMENDLVKYVLGSDFENKSVWFTNGNFEKPQYGGILKTDKYGKVTDIKIIPTYNEKYKNYSKLSGLMRIGINEISLFKELINEYAKSTIKQYYLIPWIENLKQLPCEAADISNFNFFTFNKPEEYYQVINKPIDLKKECPNIELIDINGLREIEKHDKNRVDKLFEKITKENLWTMPIIVEKNNHLILDGHHRYQVAKKLKLQKIPAIIVDYNDVLVWSLRKEIKINQKLVKKHIIENNNIYPYKTVKHKYNFILPKVNYPLEDLK